MQNFDEQNPANRLRFRVVAALIQQDGKVLLTQRWPGKHLGMIWEFPGGKVEPGENDEEALKRELLEELGIEVKFGSCCFETCHGYGNREVHLLIYRCELTSGTPKALDVKAIEWVELPTLLERNFPPADIPFVQELVDGRIAQADEAGSSADDAGEEVAFKPAQVIRRPPKS